MNTKRYVDEILKKVKMPRRHKKRLREDLTQDVEARLAKGLSLKQVIQEIGEPTAVAAELQESYPVRARTLPEIALLLAGTGAGVTGAFGLLAAAFNAYQVRLLQGLLQEALPGSASSIGIIGGADGPTVIYTTTNLPLHHFAVLGICLVCLLAYALLRRRRPPSL